MDIEDEKIYKDMIIAGIKLEARCTTTSLAIVYYYEIGSKLPTDVKICKYTLAAGCFHLAGKTEEDLLKIRDIINVFHVLSSHLFRMIHDDKIMDIDENYWEIREGLGKIEMLILRVLKFRVWRELPHKYLLYYLKTLRSWINGDEWETNPITILSWTILNDSFTRPDIITKYQPETVALSILYFVFEIYKISVPFADAKTQPWWLVLNKNTKLLDLHDICRNLIDMYNRD